MRSSYVKEGHIRLPEVLKIQDVKFREFQSKLIPTVNPDAVIGVRTPELRKYGLFVSVSRFFIARHLKS